jgi:hypothetical protein
MNLTSHFLKFPMVFGAAAIALAGCASRPMVVAGVPVHVLIAQELTLRGVAAPTLSNPSCSGAVAMKAAHVFALEDTTMASIMLHPQAGEGALPVTMLHITHLESNRTWCVMTKDDGTPAMVGGELPMGTYEVSVAEMRGAEPRRYELRVEKL